MIGKAIKEIIDFSASKNASLYLTVLKVDSAFTDLLSPTLNNVTIREVNKKLEWPGAKTFDVVDYYECIQAIDAARQKVAGNAHVFSSLFWQHQQGSSVFLSSLSTFQTLLQ